MPQVTAFPAASTPLVGDEITPLIQGGTDSQATVDDYSIAALAYNDGIAAIAGLTPAADRGTYYTGATTAALFTFTAAGRALLDDATASDQLTTLGLTANGKSLVTAANYAAMRGLLDLEAGTDFNAYSARLADISGITYAQGDVFYYDGANIVKLAAGTSGHFLKTLGAGANPTWALPSGGTIADADYGDITVSSSGTVMTIDNGVVTPAKMSFTALKAGKVSYPIAAAAMTPRTTNGAAEGTSESTTNKVMTRTLDFDQSTDEFAQVLIPMPKNWNEGTITVQFYWTATTTGDVIWGAQGVALSNDDAIDTAFGTAQTVTDSVTAAGDVMVTSETAAITIAGTPAAGDLVFLQFYRDADNGSDTLAADAKLIAVKVFITLDAEDEA